MSEWYYRMFQKNLKLRTNIVVGTVPLQNYETPQKTTDVTEDFSPHPQCTTEEYADDTQPLKNSERVERGRSSLSRTYPLCYIYLRTHLLRVNYRYLRETTGPRFTLFSFSRV